MSGNQSLHQYYTHQHQLIEQYYKECSANPDPELVHQLRLSIKKIRALDVLIGYLHPAGKSIERDFDKDLKRLFKIAGELRDTQVQIQMLEEFEKGEGLLLSEFCAWLAKREKKRISGFSEIKIHPENFNKEQLAEPETDNILLLAGDTVIQESADKALSGLFIKAQKLTAEPVSDAHLHNLRTVTKQIRYIYSMVKHSYPGFDFDKISMAELREIEAASGHWHDCLVRVELLDKFIARSKDEDVMLLKYRVIPGMFKSELNEAYQKACKVSRNGFFKPKY